MKESNDTTNAFIATGDPFTGARPQFQGSENRYPGLGEPHTKSHQRSRGSAAVLDKNLAKLADGMLLYSENMYTDRGPDPYDKPTYDATVVSYGGPLATCYKLGVRW